MPKRTAAQLPIRLDPAKAIEKALSSLELALGGRSTIISTLIQADLTDDEQTLCDQLASPENDNRSLAKVCGLAHFSVGRLLELFKKAEGAKAYVLALHRVYDKLPEVAADIVERSVPQRARCGECRGIGIIKQLDKDEDGKVKVDDAGKKIWIEVQCYPCEGTGEVTILPELERQELALKLAGMLKDKVPSVVIDQRQQAAIFRTNPDFRSATDRILFPGKSDIKVAVVPEEDNGNPST